MNGGVGKSGVSAFKWSAISTVARFGLQLIAQVVLARLLGPGNYGVFGIGMVVLTFSAFVSNLGFAWNLLHRPTVSDEDVRFAFTWQLIMGLLTMLILWLGAPWLADYFREPKVEPVIRWLSLACVMSGLASTSSNLMQRALNFRAVGLIQVFSYAVGYLVVGIPMALLGFGVNALVAAWLIQAGIAMAAGFYVHPHPVKPLFHYSGTKTAMGQSGTVFLTNIVNWWLNNLDRVVLGRMLDVHAVGFYSAGYNLATMPNSLLLNALQPSFMAAASRMQADKERLKRAYLQILATIWALTLPAFVVMSVLASSLVQFLYGALWSETGIILTILFLGMPAYVTWGISTPVLWNSGRKKHEFLCQIPVLLVGGLVFYIAAGYGVFAIAAVSSLLLVGRMLAVAVPACRALDVHFHELLPYLVGGTWLSVLAGGAAWIGKWLGMQLGFALASLILGSLFSLVTLLAAIYLRPRFIGPLTVQMLLRFSPRLEPLLVSRPGLSKET